MPDAQDAQPGNSICETAPDNGVCTLRAAVQETNALPGADTVVLPAGVYTLTLAGASEDLGRFGDLDVRDDLTLTGAGADTTVIDGNGLDRVIDVVNAGSEVIISGATIRNGSVVFPERAADDSPWTVESGGCVLSVAMLALRDSVVTGCRAGRMGGGIYAEGELVAAPHRLMLFWPAALPSTAAIRTVASTGSLAIWRSISVATCGRSMAMATARACATSALMNSARCSQCIATGRCCWPNRITARFRKSPAGGIGWRVRTEGRCAMG